MNGFWWFVAGFGSAVALWALAKFVALMGPLGCHPGERPR